MIIFSEAGMRRFLTELRRQMKAEMERWPGVESHR